VLYLVGPQTCESGYQARLQVKERAGQPRFFLCLISLTLPAGTFTMVQLGRAEISDHLGSDEQSWAQITLPAKMSIDQRMKC
jgi:hypothetical protein